MKNLPTMVGLVELKLYLLSHGYDLNVLQLASAPEDDNVRAGRILCYTTTLSERLKVETAHTRVNNLRLCNSGGDIWISFRSPELCGHTLSRIAVDLGDKCIIHTSCCKFADFVQTNIEVIKRLVKRNVTMSIITV